MQINGERWTINNFRPYREILSAPLYTENNIENKKNIQIGKINLIVNIIKYISKRLKEILLKDQQE